MTGLPRDLARDLVGFLLVVWGFSFIGYIIYSSYHSIAMRGAWENEQRMPSGWFDKIVFYLQPTSLSVQFGDASDSIKYHRRRSYLGYLCFFALMIVGADLFYLLQLVSGTTLA